MKNRILITVLMFMPPCGAWGHSMVTDVPAVPSGTSIVRYWKSEISIVYSRSVGYGDCFLLVDETSPDILRINVPTGVKVSDFRILNDTVYACGCKDMSGTQCGMLACFAIQDFYNGSGNRQSFQE